MKPTAENILCIHYYFPPLRSPAVIRNYKMAFTFAKNFHTVNVITSNNYKHFPTTEEPLPENLNILDASTYDYRYLVGKKSKKGTHVSVAKKSNPIFQYLLKVQKSFPFNLFLAEGNLIYIWNAYRTAKKIINQEQTKTIYSSFGPYADHYVCYLLKRKFPSLRWIADFRDLQVEPIYKNVIWKRLQQWMERKVLAKADKVVCISEGFVDQLKGYGRQTQAILRGVEIRERIPQYADKFSIAYTGSLYFDYRDPSAVFKCLSDLISTGEIKKNEIRIIYAGRDSAKFSKYIEDADLDFCYENKGLVSSKEAKEVQGKSHINLLLTSSSKELSGVLTGKIFEYFEALNPTLCLINGVKDKEFESIFKELKAGVVVYNPPLQEGSMATFILNKYKEWQKSKAVKPTINIPILKEKYSWEAQVEKMLK